MSESRTSTSSPVDAWRGAGWFNLYFLAKFALAYFDYLVLNAAANALLFAVVVFPVRNRWLLRLRDVAAGVAAFALLWHESWLPGPEVIAQNAGNLADFTPAFLWDVVRTSVNPELVAWTLTGFVAWYFLRHWVRFSTLTVIGLIVVAFPQMANRLLSNPTPVPTETTANAELSRPAEQAVLRGPSPAQPAGGTADDVSAWLERFFAYEADRQISLPTGPIAESTSGSFDIALVNICSLSQDDLNTAGLQNHPVWSRFDLRFEHFSSVTSYSGPATLRLLKSACGQPSHSDLYGSRQPECELLNRLAEAGWQNRLYLDHNGRFDDYLVSLRERAGLTPALNALSELTPRYDSFDGSPVYATDEVLTQWFESLPASPSRTVTLFNLVALHDGNRTLRSNRSLDWAPRAKRLLDDLDHFMTKLETNGRPVLFVIVPEHGAAVRGDKVQMARLREIPSPHITNVPVYCKFYGLDMGNKQRTVSTPVSYLALSELLARTITSGLYRAGSIDPGQKLDELLKDLPETWHVSQNANATVVEFAGKTWIQLQGGKWIEYPQ